MDRNTPMPLTPKEKNVLNFIESFMLENTYAPTFSEIKDHFGFASFNSVQRYLKQLQKKNYLFIPGGNQKRALQLLNSSKSLSSVIKNAAIDPSLNFDEEPYSEVVSLPLLGKVAAGQPLEAKSFNESIDVPRSLVKKPMGSFALRVQGQSMVDEGILDGDTILVQKQDHASNGDIVVAMVDNEATVKRFYLHSNDNTNNFPMVELRPANSNMEPLWYPVNSVKIEGLVVGLIRKF